METIDVLMDVLEDLRRKDYEYAMTELSDYEGDPFDTVRSMIGAGQYRQAMSYIHRRVDEYILIREAMLDY